MKKLLRRMLAMIAIIALAVTLLPISALAEAKTSFVRSQIDSHPAKPHSEASAEIETVPHKTESPNSKDSLGIEIVPHKTENPKRSEIWDGSIATSFAGGSGTQEDPFLISDGSELAYLAQEVNDNDNSYSGVYFKLTNDIYLNDTNNWENWGNGVAPQNEWIAIGLHDITEDGSPISFNGYFDGDGYAVRGIYINNQDDLIEYQGLFGLIGEESIVANVGVAESYICGNSTVGGVAGVIGYGTVTNCYNTGNISGEVYVGGIVGFNDSGNVTNCYNSGSISDNYAGIGGVVGTNTGDVINCYNTGDVSGERNIGGVVGENLGTVTDCYNTGSISGEVNVGGVIGSNADEAITNCYNVGNVIGYGWVGGVIGENRGGIISDCYNSGIITGEDYYVGGVIGWNCGSIIGCYNTGGVSGKENFGGVVGMNFSWYDELFDMFYIATVTDCCNSGSVSGEEGNGVGGVVGANFTSFDCTLDAIYNATVTNCYNIGSISGKESIGGVVGYNSLSTIDNCYNAGSVTSEMGSIGGVVGDNVSYYDEELDIYCKATVTNCYNIGNVIGEGDIGGVVGAMFGPYDESIVANCFYLDACCDNGNEYGTALTDQQMRASDSFIGFDFSSVWTMDGNPDYPYPELASNTHWGTPGTTTEPGDANGDGKITIADATLISRMALNLTESVPAADFNGDGNINIADATLTARKALNLI